MDHDGTPVIRKVLNPQTKSCKLQTLNSLCWESSQEESADIGDQQTNSAAWRFRFGLLLLLLLPLLIAAAEN